MKKSKIYISNWASYATKGCHGSGQLLSIMVRTSHFANPHGLVVSLTPRAIDLSDYREEKIDISEYRQRYFKHAMSQGSLKVGKLLWEPFSFFDQDYKQLVRGGDTLCCVCSREKAARGECHRAWAAVLLREAGWEVILDGRRLKEVDELASG